MYGVALPVFQLTQYSVIAEFIAAVHKFFQAEGRFLFGGHAATGVKTFAFAIKIMYGSAYYRFICFAIIMHQGLPDYFFFGDSCFVTVFG